MIENFVKTILKQVKEEYPHITTPNILKAAITGVKKMESYEKEVMVEWDGEDHLCKIKDYKYAYNLKIIPENGNSNTMYPVLPDIISRGKYEVGATVSIALIEGELNPVIIGD